MTSKSSDLSTASSYASISDDSDASSLVSLVCSEVEGLTEDLASPPIPREVVYHPENSSLFHPNYQAEPEFSMDVDIEPEDAPRDVPRGKSICHSLNTKNKLVFISFDLETGGKRWDNGLRFAFINGLRQCTPVCEFQVVPCFLPSWMLNLSSLALSRK